VPPIIFRKGLDMKEAVAADLSTAYHSAIVEEVRGSEFTRRSGRLTIHLAREFGFCYGVDRAVDYAYQTRKRFPDKQVFLTGEIIHNPHVNDQLRAKGIRILTDPGADRAALGPNDVVILPAFGVSVGELAELQRQGCTLVDTTCGSVLNVWKNVRRYAQDGFTAVIHGKVHHEETRATASQATDFPNGHFLIVRDHAEAELACDFIRHGGDGGEFVARFGDALSAGFDPLRHLERVGCANQTTMLMSESLEIGEMFRQAMTDRYGVNDLPARFRAFDTICSATQERQDAVVALLDTEPLTLAVVIGGYNSSNTCNLARICADRVATYHIADPSCLISADQIRHRPIGAPSTAAVEDEITSGWLPDGPLVIGLTAGASTPNNIVGQVIERLALLAQTGPSGVNTAGNSGVTPA
jgi:4-hydroxy-3-methylbut-2-en-1-yl diphosphate reductase